MNWDAIGAIGEILGALAVVLTLAYLAAQIRHARLGAADASRQGRAIGVREILVATAADPELSRLWCKGIQQEAAYKILAEEWGMSAEEAQKLDLVCISWMWLHWGQWASIKTQDDLAEIEHIISEFYSMPPMSVSWQNSPYIAMLDERFVDFVNEALEGKGLGSKPLEVKTN